MLQSVLPHYKLWFHAVYSLYCDICYLIFGERNIKISISKDENIPEIEINQTSIERAFTNLMSNAIKYSPDAGNITVKILNKNEEVEVTVTDEGCGISEEHQKKIFDRFYREDESHNRKNKGSGLGLNIVKQISEIINAKISVESEIDKGSKFTIKLNKKG